jgi:hypothetical protein
MRLLAQLRHILLIEKVSLRIAWLGNLLVTAARPVAYTRLSLYLARITAARGGYAVMRFSKLMARRHPIRMVRTRLLFDRPLLSIVMLIACIL